MTLPGECSRYSFSLVAMIMLRSVLTAVCATLSCLGWYTECPKWPFLRLLVQNFFKFLARELANGFCGWFLRYRFKYSFVV